MAEAAAIGLTIPGMATLGRGVRMLGGIAQLSVQVLAAMFRRPFGGRELADQIIQVGLRSTTCPECGELFTVDQIILAQGYANVNALTEGEPVSLLAARLPALASDVPAAP